MEGLRYDVRDLTLLNSKEQRRRQLKLKNKKRNRRKSTAQGGDQNVFIHSKDSNWGQSFLECANPSKENKKGSEKNSFLELPAQRDSI